MVNDAPITHVFYKQNTILLAGFSFIFFVRFDSSILHSQSNHLIIHKILFSEALKDADNIFFLLYDLFLRWQG